MLNKPPLLRALASTESKIKPSPRVAVFIGTLCGIFFPIIFLLFFLPYYGILVPYYGIFLLFGAILPPFALYSLTGLKKDTGHNVLRGVLYTCLTIFALMFILFLSLVFS